MNREPTSADAEHEIDLVSLWWIVWDQRYLVIASTVVCTVIAVVLALTATPLYRATVVVTEVHDTGFGEDQALGGQLGGLASLAGLGLGESGAHPERPAVLRSRHLVEEFVKQPDVLPVLMAHAKPGTSVWLTVERVRRGVLDIQEDKLKGITTVTMDWTDPAVAAHWDTEFVALANAELRDKAVADSTRNIVYLNDQVAHTSSVELQRLLYDLIEQQTKTLMLAKGRTEYAFMTVDPAVKAEIRISPRRTLMVVSGMFVGGVLGCFIAWARRRFARRREPVPAGGGG